MSAAFRHAEMTGSDNRMDRRELCAPVNPLPVKCSWCTFPDLDFVSQPYLLAKGTSNPNEMQPAEMGNFFVRERVRKVLEVVAPGQSRAIMGRMSRIAGIISGEETSDANCNCLPIHR